MKFEFTPRQILTIRSLVSSAEEVTIDKGLRRDCQNILKKIDYKRLNEVAWRMRKVGRAILDSTGETRCAARR